MAKADTAFHPGEPIAVLAVGGKLLDARSSRRSFMVINTSASQVGIRLAKWNASAPWVVADGIPLAPNGVGVYSSDEYNGEVSARAGANVNVIVVEL